jgi:hypothetical protein
MKLAAALAKPPLEAIRRTLVLGGTSPDNDAAGYWQEFRWRCDADGESKNPKLPETGLRAYRWETTQELPPSQPS